MNYNKILIFFICSFLISCSSFESNLEKASRLSSNNKDQQALNLALKAISIAKNAKQKSKALKFVADICEKKLKDYSCALSSYNELLPYAESENELEQFHYKIAEIHFNHLQDYENALTHLSEVVEACIDPVLCIDARIKIARSYYYKKEFLQCINEVELLNSEQTNKKINLNSIKFVESAILHSQALMGLTKYEQAVQPLIQAMEKYPIESNKQQVPILLSVAYRENSEYQKSLDVLQKYKNETKDPVAAVFIESQIEKMQKRLELQPGGPTGTSRRR